MLIRVPSKAIQYGYIEREIPDTGTPEGDAEAYLNYVGSFQIAEINLIKRKQGEAAAQRDGEEADRRAAEAAAAEAATNLPDDDEEVLEEASKTLAEGLGGVTQVPDEKAPWDKPAAEEPQGNPWDDGPVFDWS